MGKVISLQERSEVWKKAYHFGNLEVFVSSHGKFKFRSGDHVTQLEFLDSVTFLKEMSDALEREMNQMGMYNS